MKRDDKMTTEDFDFDLPENLIAQTPLKKRDSSRLLVLDRKRAHTIEFKKLNFFFDKHQIFKDLSFIINPGEKVALIGENGTGKSTLLRSINLLEHPEEGEIEFDDYMSA